MDKCIWYYAKVISSMLPTGNCWLSTDIHWEIRTDVLAWLSYTKTPYPLKSWSYIDIGWYVLHWLYGNMIRHGVMVMLTIFRSTARHSVLKCYYELSCTVRPLGWEHARMMFINGVAQLQNWVGRSAWDSNPQHGMESWAARRLPPWEEWKLACQALHAIRGETVRVSPTELSWHDSKVIYALNETPARAQKFPFWSISNTSGFRFRNLNLGYTPLINCGKIVMPLWKMPKSTNGNPVANG